MKPVIAASRGYCFGVGFELSLACDFRLASETCLYALPEQRLAACPPPAAVSSQFDGRQGALQMGLRRLGTKSSQTCMGVFLSSGFLFVAGSLFGAERPFLVPSPAIRFAERAEGVKGPKC
jgi:enoyl-CoA hydratase/carnithine racemase